jgi:flavin-dependent thymidylate synthase
MTDRKLPIVKLINFTPDPLWTMLWCRRVMHSPVPDTLQELKDNPEKWLGMSAERYFKEVLKSDGMPTFLEYVNLVFKFENVSRALQQQLTRHRIGFSYSIQSLRCVDLPKFAENWDYCNPCREQDIQYVKYHTKMLRIQDIYNQALADKIPIQDARGLLPMNIFSTITFSCSLRGLIDMVNKRLCSKTQDEFRLVAMMVVDEIKQKLGKEIASYFMRPCDKGYCMMKGENEQQFNEGKLTGFQNTDHCCPTYVTKFKQGEKNESK